MDIETIGSTTVVVLRFLAPIPQGHEVTVLDLTTDDESWLATTNAEAVVDATAGIVYGDYNYWHLLEKRPWSAEPPATHPVAALGKTWRARRTLQGRVLGAVVSTRDAGDRNHVVTALHITQSVAPAYR